MTSDITVLQNDRNLTVDEFILFFNERQPYVRLDPISVQRMLLTTINVTARRRGILQGFIRIVTDGYTFSAVAEMRSLPQYYNDAEYVKIMLSAAADASPTRLILATHRVNADTIREIGWVEGMTSYICNRKDRVAEKFVSVDE